MTCITECAPCQMGEHDRHYCVVQAVPEGVLGGAICTCKGECVKRGPRSHPVAEAMLDALSQEKR